MYNKNSREFQFRKRFNNIFCISFSNDRRNNYTAQNGIAAICGKFQEILGNCHLNKKAQLKIKFSCGVSLDVCDLIVIVRLKKSLVMRNNLSVEAHLFLGSFHHFHLFFLVMFYQQDVKDILKKNNLFSFTHCSLYSFGNNFDEFPAAEKHKGESISRLQLQKHISYSLIFRLKRSQLKLNALLSLNN